MQEQIQKTEKVGEIEMREEIEKIEKVTLTDETISNQTKETINNKIEEKTSNMNSNREYSTTARKQDSPESIPMFDSSSTTDLVATESSLDQTSLQDTVLPTVVDETLS